MPIYRKSSRIAAEPSVVFRWHARPEALPALIPPWESVTIEQHPKGLDVGTEVILVNRIGPFRSRWVAVHTAYEDRGVRGGSFTDEQRHGPFHTWIHHHTVTRDPRGGSLLEDTVTWELKFAPVSHWFLGHWAARRIERMFDFRHEATARAVASLHH